MKIIVQPGNPLRGTVQVPGDKSLSHRAVLFAALAEGESCISNFLVSGVTRVMLQSLTLLGVDWWMSGSDIIIKGRGLEELRTPEQPLNCGNSATTMRLLAGALVASGVSATLDGSPGLRRRPMDRIVIPLTLMGLQVETAEGGYAPIKFSGREKGVYLQALDIYLPVASAQVKSCLLLAALAADQESIIREPGPSRDHTERMLNSMGLRVDKSVSMKDGMDWYETKIYPLRSPLKPIQMTLPGDISAAAFLIVAALVTPGSNITIPGVGMNPTRIGIIEALQNMGGDICISNQVLQAGEPVADLTVRYSHLTGGKVSGPLVVRMIDEFSIFGVAAAYAEGTTIVRDASELHLKESDRILTLCEEMSKLNVDIIEAEDGFDVNGGILPSGGSVHGRGDHRLAMAMAVMGLGADSSVCVDGAEMIDESFPDFISCLRTLGANITTLDEERL